MATSAQIAANRANAQKSTGPTSEAGKAKTSRNATRHGLCRVILCTDEEDTTEMTALLADLMEEHQPQGPTEEILVYKIAEQFWFTKRASDLLAVHTTYAEGRVAPYHGDDDEDNERSEHKQMAMYLRYYTTADRAFNKNLQDLRKLHKERREQDRQDAIGSVSQEPEPASSAAGTPVAPEAPKAPKPDPIVHPELFPGTGRPIDPVEPRKKAA